MNFPVQYIGANVPQAWAAGSAFMLLQAMLGITADGATGKLFLDPHLPAWLPDVTIKDLTIDARNYALRFWREGEDTRYEVLAGEPALVERRGFADAFEPCQSRRMSRFSFIAVVCRVTVATRLGRQGGIQQGIDITFAMRGGDDAMEAAVDQEHGEALND